MKELIIISIIFLLSLISASPLKASPFQDQFIELKYYHDRISVLNLLNGLNLSEQQMQKLLELNYDIKKFLEKFKNDPDIVSLKARYKKDLKELYEYLLNHPEQEDKRLQGKAVACNAKMKEYFKNEYQNEMEKFYNNILKKANKTLTPEQIEVVNSFKPCIVPPKDFRDPVRAGQALSDSRIKKMLENVRKIEDPRRLETVCERIANKIINITHERFYKMSADEKTNKRNEIIQTLKQANALSDTDYELKEDEIIQRLTPDTAKLYKMRKKAQKDILERDPKSLDVDLTSPVRKFLLDPPVVIPILEKRLTIERQGGLR
ncbi:MAG: hypothetical protein JSV31_00665 [Desulfobacterales bacterium]|nr:MAG: hypothetical protein JSV31_00665 [Desulfobacterales bacterium]